MSEALPPSSGAPGAPGAPGKPDSTDSTDSLSKVASDRFDALGVAPGVRAPLARWLALLAEWNERMDLTAARSEDELADLMLADAAVLARYIGPGARVVDVGTGAGAPGLALALLRPDLDVTLVEPIAKRTSFLQTVVGTLQRLDVTILRERGETLAARSRRAYDVAISRATLAPPEWIPLALRLAPAAWVLLARDEPPVLANTLMDVDVDYVWPLTGARRRAVRYHGIG